MKYCKKIVAIPPLDRGGHNFKMYPYLAWKNIGGNIRPSHYPTKFFHGLLYKFEFPTLFRSSNVARLKFVEVASISFDSFPDYLYYELIPIIWDCWPSMDRKLIKWIESHKVNTCIFTSSRAAYRIKQKLSHINILVITEGIETSLFSKGKELKHRKIDLYSYGRLNKDLYDFDSKDIIIQRGGVREQFLNRLRDAKITIALPRCDVEPEYTGGQETLTQRFWECMLSRTVLLGRAPKELIDLIGYNPVIDIDYKNYVEQVKDITSHIEDYQELVDRNRETALRMAPWELRMKQVMDWLKDLGYEV